jgi:hypothetical protein
LPQPAITDQYKADLDRCFDRFGLDAPAYLPAGRKFQHSRAAE